MVHLVRITVVFGLQDNGIKTMGKPLSVMAHLKKCIVQVKTETNCLANALLIGIAQLMKDSHNKAYRKGRNIYPKVDRLLATTGIILDNGGEIPELQRFQAHFRQYKIFVYTGLSCD